MGASGAGKSTLLSLLNGTLTPTSGAVKINNIDIHHQKEELEGVIGHISQDDLLIEDLTVFENLFYNTKLCYDGLPEKIIVKKAIEMLKSLGLHEIKDLKVGSPLNKKISGGQRKRLNIALELIREPQVLFVDEPTSGLDPIMANTINNLIRSIVSQLGATAITISHDLNSIRKIADDVLMLHNGSVVWEGSLKNFEVTTNTYVKKFINAN